MPNPVSLLDAPAVRIHERTDSNLVSLFHSDLHERTGVAWAPDGRPRNPVRSDGQLFSLDRRLGEGPETNGPAVEDGLAEDARTGGPGTEPHSRRALCQKAPLLLLDDLSE